MEGVSDWPTTRDLHDAAFNDLVDRCLIQTPH